MSYTNKELVEFFISYKLSQKNYSTSVLRPEDASGGTECDKATKDSSNGLLANSRKVSGQLGTAQLGGIEAVKAALQDSADKFELLFTQSFSDLSSQIDITHDTAYHSFKSVMDEVFKDGVNWGRIVGLFSYGGVISVKCVEKGMSELIPRIVGWMTTYLDEHISPWIQSHGGWDRFAEMFGSDAAARRESQETLRRWLLVGVALITGVVVGALFVKKQ